MAEEVRGEPLPNADREVAVCSSPGLLPLVQGHSHTTKSMRCLPKKAAGKTLPAVTFTQNPILNGKKGGSSSQAELSSFLSLLQTKAPAVNSTDAEEALRQSWDVQCMVRTWVDTEQSADTGWRQLPLRGPEPTITIDAIPSENCSSRGKNQKLLQQQLSFHLYGLLLWKNLRHIYFNIWYTSQWVAICERIV